MTGKDMMGSNIITRVKLYKSGKLWVAAIVTIAGFATVTVTQTTTTFASADAPTTSVAEQANNPQKSDVAQTQDDVVEPVSTPQQATNTPETTPETPGQAVDAIVQEKSAINPSETAVNKSTASKQEASSQQTGTMSADKDQSKTEAVRVNEADASPVDPAGTAKSPIETSNPLVTTKDSNGDVSVDPDHTGENGVAITPVETKDYFNAQNKDKQQLTIDDTGAVVLTDGTIYMKYPQYNKGLGLLVANQQIDFKSNFSLDVTMSAKYDPDTMKNANNIIWLGGDGTSLFFAPLDASELSEKAVPGEFLGLPKPYNTDGKDVLSFNISTNARNNIVGYTDKEDANQWYVFQGNANALEPVDDVVATGIAIGQEKGQVSYNFNMNYKAANREITTIVTDELTNTQLQKWTYAIPNSWSNETYSMGVSASIADSRATYTAKVNSYTYTPVKGTLNIAAQGLPSDVEQPTQTGIKGMAGNIVAFYPAGTTPTTMDENGVAVATAIEVPAIDGYTLKDTQFVTIGADATTITLNYHKPTSIDVHYFGDDGRELQPATEMTGDVGAKYSLAGAPKFEGYTFKAATSSTNNKENVFIDGPQTVTYLYTKDVVASAGTTVHFFDENGNQIADSQTFSGNVGETYDSAPATIDGYTYQHLSADSAPVRGLLSTAAETVNYLYTKDPVAGAPVRVSFVDSSGNVLRADETLTGNIDDSYSVAPVEIAGYTYQGLANSSGPKSGLIASAPQRIMFIYKKNATPTTGTTPTLPQTGGGTITDQPAVTPAPTAAVPTVVPATPELPATGGTLSPTEPVHNALPDTHSAATPQQIAASTSARASRPRLIANAVSQTKQVTLPQTGEQHNQVLALIGAALLGLTALFGLQLRRREK
ncbi:MucBP domain-containing protein [Lacticaseibacillus pabuli]|uniref:MucBP domain-containing protein n=1 Tax=Lacticaseibacillus pabuli TaxID=3025672 RepID=A0ABY7WV77_9LACO|nr:MucBP domain-containing protein [Lacticaseibacillus sp. KACC 23028]WDF83060.1 MucBP domain-containing protein [Lacticaseibacillus sp. KACC 23028]